MWQPYVVSIQCSCRSVAKIYGRTESLKVLFVLENKFVPSKYLVLN